MERADERADRHPFWGEPESLAEAESWLRTVQVRLRDIERDIAIGRVGGELRDEGGYLVPRDQYPRWRAARLTKKDKVLNRLQWLKDWIATERERLGVPGKGVRKPSPSIDAMFAAARRFVLLEAFATAFSRYLDADEEGTDAAWKETISAYDGLEEQEVA